MSSNKACCWILGILAGGFVLTVLVIGWGISQAMSSGFKADFGSNTTLEPNSWLVLRPSGDIPEYNVDPDLGFLGGSGGSSLNDMIRAIEKAQDDPNISGIVLRPMGTTGMATLRELREALLKFKQGEKPIYAHFDFASDRDYYLASVSDSIFMMPGRLSGINFGGLAFSSTYLKSTFEKVGLKFHVIHAGRYKGAFENFSHDSMSTDLRTSLTYLYEDVYDTYIRETADSRPGLTFAKLDNELQFGDQFIVGSATCVERGYVDGLLDWPVLRHRLQGDSEDFEGISARRYLSTKKLTEIPTHESEIAVVFAQGEISFGEDADDWGGDEITASGLVKQLDDLADDESVKSVVLRVNSPGGSALASKQILEAALRLKEKKPIVVSMGRVAASGGYYISMAANQIVAQPNTITGSIGVVSMIPSAEELYKNIGAREETISIGRWANFFRFDKTLGPEQEQVLRSLMDSVYLEFREDVAKGRGLELSSLDSLAEGRVWTGNQAIERDLVDTLGGLNLAINLAAQEASLGSDEYDLGYYPKEKDVFEFIISQFSTRFSALENLGRSARALDDPQALLEYVKNYFSRLEFLQTILPASIVA